MSFYDAIRVGASGAADFEVKRSLRFNDDDSPGLSRTPSSTGNQRTFTVSAWVKRAKFDSGHTIFSVGPNGSNLFAIYFPSEQFSVTEIDGGSQHLEKNSSARFRDPTAWYHVLAAIDTTQSTAEDRVIAYINGERITYAFNNIFSQNTDTIVNSTNTHYVGRMSTGNYFDGYIAEFNFIDGQQLTPSSFAETDTLTGEYKPIKYTGTYGTNGFYLNFLDNSNTTATTLGKDSSGNGHNFTPSNLSVSAGAGNDSLEDSPTNNFCTINPLAAGRLDIFPDASNGNLDFNISSSFKNPASSFQIPTSGKWYAEYVFTTVGSGVVNVGNLEKAQGSSAAEKLNGISLLSGEIRVNDSATQTSLTAFGANDIIGVKVDRDAGTVAFTINGSAVGNAENISSMNAPTDLVFRAYRNSSGGSAPVGSVNFGQRPFSYLPSGFKALNSQNLPDPTIKLPNKYFDLAIWDGNSTQDRDITGFNFKPDWVWIKSRNGGTYGGGLYYHHVVWDSVRGVGSNSIGAASRKELTINENYIEGRGANYSDYYGHVSAFNSDGFELDHVTGEPPLYVNRNTNTYVGWCWDAGETDSATYTVKVVSDSGNKYRFNDYGTSAVTLDLAEGGTYTFDQSDSSMSSHPMKLSTTANGTHGGGSSYNTGVTYQLDGSSVTESAFVSGFSSASSRKLIITVAASAPTLYYYCHYHSGMGGAINTNTTLGSSNFDGSIQSTVKANTTAGFSIATWVSDGSGSPTSFGHGLGVRPDFLIIKNRTGSGGNWQVWSSTFSNATNNFISLNLDTGTQTAGAAMWGTIDSSVVNFRHSANSSNGNTMIGYFFSEVTGYSKVGTYTGNGSTNGTFVFTNFRPAFILLKRTNSSASWVLHDSKRAGYNGDNDYLHPDLSQAESDGSSGTLDILSNGFKLKMTAGTHNGSGDSYIYIAFAKSPFKNSRAR